MFAHTGAVAGQHDFEETDNPQRGVPTASKPRGDIGERRPEGPGRKRRRSNGGDRSHDFEPIDPMFDPLNGSQNLAEVWVGNRGARFHCLAAHSSGGAREPRLDRLSFSKVGSERIRPLIFFA